MIIWHTESIAYAKQHTKPKKDAAPNAPLLQQLLFVKVAISVSFKPATIASTNVGITHIIFVINVVMSNCLFENLDDLILIVCNKKIIIAFSHPTTEKNMNTPRDTAILAGIESLLDGLGTAAAEIQDANWNSF